MEIPPGSVWSEAHKEKVKVMIESQSFHVQILGVDGQHGMFFVWLFLQYWLLGINLLVCVFLVALVLLLDGEGHLIHVRGNSFNHCLGIWSRKSPKRHQRNPKNVPSQRKQV